MENRLDLQGLDESVLQKITERLIEKRVVQYIPADMSGLKVEENTRGIKSIENGKYHLNPPHDKGALTLSKLIGVNPCTSPGKLVRQRGVRVITDNFGLAILDNVKDGFERFQIIPWFKVGPQIYKGLNGRPSLVEQNGGKMPRILRNGMAIRIGKFKVLKPTRVLENSEWGVESIGDFDGVIKVDLKPRDVVRTRYDEPDPSDSTGKKKIKKTTAGCKLSTDFERVYEGGLTILKTSLTGTENACPITSSA